MPATMYLAVLLVMAPLAYLTTTSLNRSGRALAIARRNLTRGLFSPVIEVGTLESRGAGSGSLLRVLTPDSAAARIRRLLQLSGYSGATAMMRALWAKIGLGLAGLVLGLLMVLGSPGLLSVVFLVVATGGGYFVPDLVLRGRGKERQEAIQLALPDTLDQMTVAVAAGLGFESALARAAANGKGPLAEELTRTLQDVAVGRPRREAYAALVRRTDVTDLQRFVGAINQADSYGIAIAEVLRSQAEDLRDKRKQRAETKAQEIPVKVTFPLMVCILPALLIVVLGPAIMNLVGVFG